MKSILNMHKQSDHGVQPLCPVFGECGGCFYQNVSYQDELKIKEIKIKDLLTGLDGVSDDLIDPIIPSPKPYHYRNRLDLKLKRTKANEVFIGFTPIDSKGVVAVDACYIAEQKISNFIPELKRQAINRLPKKYRNANLTVRCGSDQRVLWGGIGRKSCQLPPEDYFWLDIEGKRIFYSLDTFFQTNYSILPALFEMIRGLAFWDSKPTMFDLYGGVGLFGIGLIDQANQVILIEENVQSLKLAKYSVDFNRIQNIKIIEGRVEDHLSNLLQCNFNQCNVAMIDPPRAGLSKEARGILTKIHGLQFIMYLSCNPETLARDLKDFIGNGWQVQKITPFDFFPKTKHLETLVLLKQ